MTSIFTTELMEVAMAMLLESGEVVMEGYRLFDHIKVALEIQPSELAPEGPMYRAQVSLDTISQTRRIVILTEPFRQADIPGFGAAQEARTKVTSKTGDLSYSLSYLILLYLQHNGGVSVEFRSHEDIVDQCVVHLGRLRVVGTVPEAFDVRAYFDEKIGLQD